MYQHPSGASVSSAASWLQDKCRFCKGGEKRNGNIGCTQMLMLKPFSQLELEAALALAQLCHSGQEAPTLTGEVPHGLTVPQALETKL